MLYLGNYEGRRSYADEYSATVGDRAAVTVRQDNLRMEGEFIRKVIIKISYFILLYKY